MRPRSRMVVLFSITALAHAGVAHAQGRGGGNWTTAGGDAQRTGSVRTDPRISVQSAQKPGFQLLWKRQLDPKRQQALLTQPVLLPNIISYKGFKALAFVAGADTVYSIDYDLNRMFWERRLNSGPAASSGPACPAGLAAVTRATPMSQGFPPPLPAPGAPQTPGAGRGRAGGPGGGGRGGSNNVYAVSSGGMVHALNPQTGEDVNPPAKFLAANARLAGVVYIDGVLYAAATGNCGGVPNGVHALDLAENANTVTTWDSRGAAIAGNLGTAFGPDGTIYVATGASSSDSSFANAVVALEARTLKAKDWFTAATPFTSSPVVFSYKGRTLVAAGNADGRLYVLDAVALGGSDRRRALATSTQYSKGSEFSPGALASWEDAGGTRWIALATAGVLSPDAKFASTNGALTSGGIVAFKIVDENGPVTIQPVWASRDIPLPGTPMLLNGVVFAVSNGEYRAAPSREQRGRKSVLYALDAATGKELWNSGSTITSFVPGVPPSGGDGQVYVVTADGTLYAFGIPLEH